MFLSFYKNWSANSNDQATTPELESLSKKTECYINNTCEVDYVDIKESLKTYIAESKTNNFEIALTASNYLSLLYENKGKLNDAIITLENIYEDEKFSSVTPEKKYPLLSNLYRYYKNDNNREKQLQVLEEILSFEKLDLDYESWEIVKIDYITEYEEIKNEN